MVYFRNLSNAPKEIPELHPEKTTRLLESFAYFDLIPHLSRIEAEKTIYVGEEDKITGLTGAFKIFERTSAVMTVYPGENHTSVLKVIKNF